MMESERAEGIVLRVQPVTETSLLVTWFTREHGKLKTLAKGARRPKSHLRGKIDLFYEDEIIFLRSRRSDLHLLSDCFLENPRKRLRANVSVLAAASYACELVESVTEIEDPNPDIYVQLQAILNNFEERIDLVALIWFELQVMNATGWRVDCSGPGGTDKVLQSLSKASISRVARVRLTDSQTQAALFFLWRLRENQFGRALRAQKLLKAQIER